jgi:hypothetical protein
MEMTMLARLCMSQNIHVLLKNLPPELGTIGEAFSRAFDSDQRGTLPNEVGGYQDRIFTFPNSVTVTQLGDEMYTLLRSCYPNTMPPRGALLQPSIIYRRATYSTFNTSEANSFVILGDCCSGNWRAAQITDIIVQKTEELNPVMQYRTVIAVHLFNRLSDNDLPRDIYMAEGRNMSVGRLFYKRPDTTKILVQVEDLTCHFARNPLPKVPGINKDCIHIRPLYRVSHMYLFLFAILTNKTYTGLIIQCRHPCRLLLLRSVSPRSLTTNTFALMTSSSFVLVFAVDRWSHHPAW